MQDFDPNKVPSALISLLLMAKEWGLRDDYEREMAIDRALPEELESLVHSIDGISDNDLFGWLSGPVSYNLKPSDEYLALTCYRFNWRHSFRRTGVIAI